MSRLISSSLALFSVLLLVTDARSDEVEDTVLIHITGRGTRADYILHGESEEKPVHVRVGQTVRWANDGGTTTAHTATSIARDADGARLFNTGRLDVGEQADVLFDQDLYDLAGGAPGSSVELEYFCIPHGQPRMSSTIVLEDATDRLSGRHRAFTGRRASGTTLVRKKVASLTSTEIDSLRRGIAVMKSRPLSDRTSWQYWANIHGVRGTSTDPLWAQCEHRNIQFLTWHRAYLYYFEQILRDASGDPDLTLPYWDWSTNRALPSIYRSPASSSNSLYDPDRQMNNGSLLPRRIVVTDLRSAMRQRRFPPFSFDLDGSPHGQVHVLVGGPSGTMRFVETSANDPIFWAHHANVDRLWNRWLDQGGGRTNPNDSGVLNRRFTFVDTSGANVDIRVRDILDQSSLGYRYDDEPTRGRMMLVAGRSTERPEARAKRLGFEPEVVELSLPRGTGSRLATARAGDTGAAAERLKIDVVGVEFKKTPSYVYGVYLNLPEGEANDERLDLHYVGSISFFAREHHQGVPGHGRADADTSKIRFSQSLDATDAAARLQAAGVEIDDQLSVTLRPITLIPAEGEEAQLQRAARSSAAAAEVSYEAIEIRVVSE